MKEDSDVEVMTPFNCRESIISPSLNCPSNNLFSFEQRTIEKQSRIENLHSKLDHIKMNASKHFEKDTTLLEDLREVDHRC